MALSVYSKFYYGFKITENACAIDFVDGTGVHEAILTVGTYTLAGIVAELSRAINATGGQAYTVTVDRATRKISISADEPFELLCENGANQYQTAFPLLGYTGGIDLAGETSYEGEDGAGFEYEAQFPLQSYLPTWANKRPISGAKKKTATGIVEAVRIGLERRMECELLYVTDIPHPQDHIIRTNVEGVSALVKFLDYATTLAQVEFMEDGQKPDEFEVLVLDVTEDSPDALGYKLREQYDEDLPDYYRTGKLTWYAVEVTEGSV